MYYTYSSPRVFNVVLCAMSILSCFSLFAVELIFCFLVSHNKKVKDDYSCQTYV